MPGPHRVFCRLTCNGTDLVGFNDIESLAGEDLTDSLRVYELEWGFTRNLSEDGALVGGTAFRRVRMVKRIDAATPVISQSLSEAATVDAVFKIFDNGPDGADRLLFTITGTNGRLTSQRAVHRSDAASLALPTDGAHEEIHVAFNTIEQAHVADPMTESIVDWTPSGPV